MPESGFINKREVREKYVAKWLKIFYHNSKNCEYFKDEEEAKYLVSDENRFSILKLIPYVNRYEKNKYEFLLEYPEKGGFNRWKQTSNPIITTDVEGLEYNASDVKWPIGFDGLAKFKGTYTFLAGCSKSPNR